MMRYFYLIILSLFIIASCSKSNGINNYDNNSDNDTIINDTTTASVTKNLTIFFINDQHGQLDNFSKIKYIVDQEKQSTNVILACSGDMFSGNPVVDFHSDKGYPMIDVMNRVGFDISVFGNHEFDYGQDVLKKRVEQANFSWVCANVDMGTTNVPDPFEYKTITVDNLKVTFLGLVETDGKQDETIPSTHPWKVKNFSFERPENVITQYSDVKAKENSDLYIALSHLGYDKGNWGLGDKQLATQYPYFDLIIGGHSHQKIDDVVNNIPIFQAGSNLKYLGKIKLTIKNKKIITKDYTLINLDTYTEYDNELKTVIDNYNDMPFLKEVIGSSALNHSRSKVGCFLTDALKGTMNVDIAFQNSGGVRSDLNEGDITKREIYEISPFNNGTIIYSMSVLEIKNFLKGDGGGFYYSGMKISQSGNSIIIKDLSDNTLSDNTILSVGVIDYIPAVNDMYFPANGDIQSLNDAETIIYYLENINSTVNYPSCSNYFNYSK